MKPITGVVTKITKSIMVIKTEIGLVIETQRDTRLLTGDTCFIAYDYTKNKVNKILLTNQIEEIPIEFISDDYDQDEQNDYKYHRITEDFWCDIII